MKKGFGAYIEERATGDFDFLAMLTENQEMTFDQIGKEFGTSKQNIGDIVQGAMNKIFDGMKSTYPDMSDMEIFYVLCQAFKGANPRTVFKSLGYKRREAIKQEAIEKGIRV